jgi:hypothetical protein
LTEVYNGNEHLKDLDNVKDVREAYEMLKSCYLVIGIFGKFMFPMGGAFMQSVDTLNREMIGNLPYWFLLKLNPEFLLIDNHVQKIMFNKD